MKIIHIRYLNRKWGASYEALSVEAFDYKISLHKLDVILKRKLASAAQESIRRK